MKIAVTGGSGFIGQYLLRDYSSEHEFVVPLRKKNRTPQELHFARYIDSDYTVENLKKIFTGCDAVIHLAGKKNVITQGDYIQNIQLGSNVFEACKELQINNIVNISSRAVFGNEQFNSANVVDEKESPHPDNLYGLSKVCTEVLAEFYNCNYDMNIKTYRMGEVCGLDLNYGMSHIFWKKLLDLSMRGQELPLYGTGNGGRDLIYVKDVTNALIMGVKEANQSGIFNIGNGSILTNKEIAMTFCDVFGNKAGIKLYPEQNDGGTKWWLNVEKAKHIFGFETGYHIRDIVEDIKQEYIKFRCMEEMNKIG